MTTVIETTSGKLFDLSDPNPDLVYIDDIARSLAKVVRYNGHIDRVYTTGTHCCLLSDWVLEQPWGNNEKALLMLMHHGVDVYISDIPFAVRHIIPEIKPLKEAVERCVAARFDLEWPWPQWLLNGNIRMIKREQGILTRLSPDYLSSLSNLTELNIDLPDWTFEKTEGEFLKRFRNLTKCSDDDFFNLCSR